MAEPSEGKKSVKVVTNPETGRENKISYGAKGYRIRPGTPAADRYCARSKGIKDRLTEEQQRDPNSPNNLSRKKWHCSGDKSIPD